jgi:hypothetical protein
MTPYLDPSLDMIDPKHSSPFLTTAVKSKSYSKNPNEILDPSPWLKMQITTRVQISTIDHHGVPGFTTSGNPELHQHGLHYGQIEYSPIDQTKSGNQFGLINQAIIRDHDLNQGDRDYDLGQPTSRAMLYSRVVSDREIPTADSFDGQLFSQASRFELNPIPACGVETIQDIGVFEARDHFTHERECGIEKMNFSSEDKALGFSHEQQIYFHHSNENSQRRGSFFPSASMVAQNAHVDQDLECSIMNISDS